MSKADQLGAGRFGGGTRPVSARRQAVAAATGVPTDGVAPPTELPPSRISLNPDNPRSSLGDLTDLAGSLKTHGQKQAITVMNRDAYIAANPDRAADLEHDATHVVIDGSSRLAAAREAGLATLKVMVSDDEGSTSEELLESALVANIHRQDLEELDEARALQRLLAIHGSQTALAKRLHRSQGWVSQRLALLNLTPELQARIGQEPIDLLRAVGNKPAQEQEPALQALKEKRERKEAGGKRRPSGKVAEAGHVEERGGADEADGHYGVIEGAASEGAPLGAQAEADRVLPKTVPEPRADTAARLRTSGDDTEGAVQTVPWDEPESLAMLLDRKVESDDDFFTLLLLLGSKAAARDPQRLPALLSDLALRAPASAE
ncbi:ParB/RepB/Spo0J family partition protein [Streptomyces sp. NRRL_B-16638]|jgi:ParB family chromosome partitioning protein|uniref:Plasmid partitioning protein, parb1 n=2 Tax=Streptomyces coelicolor TaxID=1902 RepID=S4W8J2_STRCH|nr:ParB/RepB/Spo0J family partition protein [Streptomyces sp. NRRL_B-16638]AGO88601.1 plasmid partitioning protein, parb1 [Streptomyces coelicolor]MDX2930330.1 ParB/RepB/Spo0J family partition protein [Streptomyces sp. NRRL_B-16638]CAC36660.1 probable plasmid partitioning protein, ParB1 [Streptomyces coelicolor A3(2)]